MERYCDQGIAVAAKNEGKRARRRSRNRVDARRQVAALRAVCLRAVAALRIVNAETSIGARSKEPCRKWVHHGPDQKPLRSTAIGKEAPIGTAIVEGFAATVDAVTSERADDICACRTSRGSHEMR